MASNQKDADERTAKKRAKRSVSLAYGVVVTVVAAAAV